MPHWDTNAAVLRDYAATLLPVSLAVYAQILVNSRKTMFYLEIVFTVLFILLTVVGYRKSNRNIMLLGSICLVISFGAEPFLNGFSDGFNQTMQQNG